ncbi:hypothetical protein BDW75DRAFT_212317 [Aspergillus navahoensis]
MKHIRGLVSTTQALRQTFLLPQASRASLRPQFSCYSPVQTLPQVQVRYTSSGSGPQGAGEIKDEDIQSDYVQVVGENNKLSGPTKLSTFLSSLQRPQQYLLQVQAGTRDRLPVCKVINRREAQERARAFAKAAKASKKTVKQVELNWAIDPHDLSHRLKKITDFLEKGIQVEIILTRKRHKRPATEEEVRSVMEKILQAIKDADATQISPMEGEPGKRVVLTVKKKDT